MKHAHHFLLALLAAPAFAAGSEPINFSRDIRPILSAKCFACHGPDSAERDADYRLDTEEGAFADLGGYSGIVPGKPEQSELYLRITNPDEDDLMPPPKHKKPATAEEIALLKRWIEQGAPYSGHWAFQPVTRPALPESKEETGNGIDRFIAARLESEGLTFSPAAPPETLFRRLHLDLTGLPPGLAELDAFLQKPDEAAYEAAVDKLMDSGPFAERLAMEWLDVARYADTNGYSIDDHREMWAWRDWVLHAYQTNLPYDEFIRQQLAGDLMENATDRMKVATGFLRNSMNTHEGGTIAEEYRVAAIADKIDTVSSAFLGLTMKCAQCHDHKYDPISQRDYYRFFAYFNTSSEPGKGAQNGNTKPFLEVDPILRDGAAFRAEVAERIAALEYLKAHPEEILGEASKISQEELPSEEPPNPGSSFPVPRDGEAKGLSWIWVNPAGSGEFAWFRKTFSLEKMPERARLFVSCDNEAEIWVNGKRLGKNPDWREPSVFDLLPLLIRGENLIAVGAKDWTDGGGKAALLALAAFSDGTWLATDGSWLAADRERANWNLPGYPGGFSAASVVAPRGAAPWGNVFARLDQGGKSVSPPVRDPEVDKLIKSLDGEIGALKNSLKTGKTTVMIMDEAAAGRKTPILLRGQYDQPGEIVESGIPAVFGGRPGSGGNRLDLARWLTDPAQPLTARVTVNRYWQMLFGTGLVKTAEDFGSQGEWPSHPELLDWLASEFVASGWNARALLRTMLLSRTYRQSSDVSKELLARDPYNRLLARAPRFRLSAEAVRDGALAIGGLLDGTFGGPSVYPPQPRGLWKEVSHFGHPTVFTAQHFFPDRGTRVYRRSLYTFWKRSSPPPVLTAFDAPNRETCAVRRSLTNTPLQALALMNEPQFVEASRGLAGRMMSLGGPVAGQIRRGFRLAAARNPSSLELGILEAAYRRQLAYFGESPERTAGYAGKGRAPEFAAMTSVASLILNLDETITRE